MTVTNLWNTCGNWTPFSKVCIHFASSTSCFEYNYSEDVLKDWADAIVLSFIYNSITDTMSINLE